MYKRSVLIVFLLAGATAALAQPAGITAREILSRADALLRGDTQQGTYTMQIIRPDWERSTRFEFWSEGTELSFIRMLEPARDRGVTFLKRGREMWNYVPRINRVIKIPPSMMLQSWMGSDFTNDDLVKESSVIDDYTHELLGVDTLDGAAAYRLALTPKPDAPVAWARVVEWIRVADFIPIRAEYFNERGEPVRTMRFTDVRDMDGRRLPVRMELTDPSEPGEMTVMILDDVRFDKPIAASVFSQANLRRGS